MPGTPSSLEGKTLLSILVGLMTSGLPPSGEASLLSPWFEFLPHPSPAVNSVSGPSEIGVG